ncbi:MAG: molybdenum cofactor biosynthesis protein MoaE [Acidimicrobiales bacterium]
MGAAETGRDWVGLRVDPLPVCEALSWVVLPECGAVATFVGTVRDHSEGRSGVRTVDYEAFVERVEPRLADIAAAARRRWPAVGRLVLLHRVGKLAVGDPSVLVAASAPHRAEAFEIARFCIDTIKSAVPIWKKETWAEGSDWGSDAHGVREVGEGA